MKGYFSVSATHRAQPWVEAASWMVRCWRGELDTYKRHCLMMFVSVRRTMIMNCLLEAARGLNSSASKKSFQTDLPDSICPNVHPGSIMGVGRSFCQTFTSDWLYVWFNLDIVNHFSEKRCSQVSNFIMSHWVKPPLAKKKAWSTEKLVPQTHAAGILDTFQPYWRAIAAEVQSAR